jgi:hypothetical protein
LDSTRTGIVPTYGLREGRSRASIWTQRGAMDLVGFLLILLKERKRNRGEREYDGERKRGRETGLAKIKRKYTK